MTTDLRHEIPAPDALAGLYASVGWTTYAAAPDELHRAVTNSTYAVSAWSNDHLVGFARCVSDDVSIAYLQDILVEPGHQGAGIGSRLMHDCLGRFAHVRQFVLLTDDRPEQLGFYASLGFSNTRDLVKTPLNAFVRISGVTLE